MVSGEKIGRRAFLKYTGVAALGLVVGAAAGWFLKPTPTGPTPTGPTPTERPYEGVHLTLLSHTYPFICKPFYKRRKQFEEETGATLEILEEAPTDIYTKAMTELIAGTGAYDLITYNPCWMDISYYCIPLNNYIRQKDPGWGDILPSVKRNVMIGNNIMGWPLDGDVMIFAYRKDILQNPEYQREFKKEYGYDLPVPPKSWDEFRDVATFFTGWDWDGDGEIEYGSTELGRKERCFWGFYPRAYPMTILPGGPDKYHGVFHFDPETMEPLINSPGCIKALEEFKYIVQKCSPPGVLANEFV